jgi:biopolymer transport protein ExbD
MAFGHNDFSAPEHDQIMGEINMTPLVDVMLVLLVIFILAAPVLHHATRVDLPQASSQPQTPEPSRLRLSIQADGHYLLDEQPISDAALQQRLQAAAHQTPPAALHIHGDKAVRYERVAQAMASAQLAGLRQIGFVTQP